MPGLAASSMVFENIRLENPNYQLYRLDWIQPKKNESIKSYCLRLSKKIKHKQPILLGVSFGGIIVQELDKIVNAQSHISNKRGTVGARVNSLERQAELLIERQNAVEKDVSDLKDADLAALVTNLQSKLTSMQASQQSFVKISQLNLFDYLR